MGHHGARHRAKMKRQLASRRENELYYQNSREQMTPRTEAERSAHRREATASASS